MDRTPALDRAILLLGRQVSARLTDHVLPFKGQATRLSVGIERGDILLRVFGTFRKETAERALWIDLDQIEEAKK